MGDYYLWDKWSIFELTFLCKFVDKLFNVSFPDWMQILTGSAIKASDDVTPNMITIN